jgi:fluoroquinolone transport system permease protein
MVRSKRDHGKEGSAVKRVCFLLHADLKNILRDPLLFPAAAGPLLLTLLFRLGTPAATGWLERVFAFDLTPFHGLIQAVVLQRIPFITGLVAGLLMLQERDENLIPLFAVTPLMKSGYLRIRLFTPVLLTWIYLFLIVNFAGLIPVDAVKGLAGSLPWTMEAPMLALLLAAFFRQQGGGVGLDQGSGNPGVHSPRASFPAVALAAPDAGFSHLLARKSAYREENAGLVRSRIDDARRNFVGVVQILSKESGIAEKAEHPGPSETEWEMRWDGPRLVIGFAPPFPFSGIPAPSLHSEEGFSSGRGE